METTYRHLDINPLGEESYTLAEDVRITCPTISGTTLVYEGIAAGNHYNHHGGGANVICVKDLKYNPGSTTANISNGILHGSEYAGQALKS